MAITTINSISVKPLKRLRDMARATLPRESAKRLNSVQGRCKGRRMNGGKGRMGAGTKRASRHTRYATTR